MAQETDVFKLKKPSPEDFYDINVHNENMDAIDHELRYLWEKINTHEYAIDNVNNDMSIVKPNIDNHLKAQNPHNITATTVGLDKVPNVATNDQTPTYSEASTLATLTSGEKISIAFGKIKKAITDLISHLADTTKHITSAERTSWNTNTTTISEVRKIAEASGFKLLKTQAIATGNIGNIGYSYIPVTGVDVFAYDELRLFFEGTGKFKSVSNDSESSTTVLFGFDSYAYSMSQGNYNCVKPSNFKPNTEKSADISCETEITSLNYCETSIANDGTITLNKNIQKAKTIRSPGTSSTKGTAEWSNNAIYFNMYEIGSSKDFEITITGNVYVYGKGKIK